MMALTFAFYITFVVVSVLNFILSYSIAESFSVQTYMNFEAMSYLVLSITCFAFTMMVNWIALKYNQPLMTRTDAQSGENVSLLMFIKSKYDMQNIFDPDEPSEFNDDNEEHFAVVLNASN